LSDAAADPEVLSRLYLDAVLPCLAALTATDAEARSLVGTASGSIVLKIFRGPAATISLQPGAARWSQGAARGASVVLLFAGERHLNAFFSGRQWAVPIPVWGGWRIALLRRFAALAARLEAVMDGHAAVVSCAAGRALHARLSLIAAVLGLGPLAAGDIAARQILRSLPPGLAAFQIRGDPESSVWFEHGATRCMAGRGAPPHPADVCVAFDGPETAYAAMREEIDTFAAVGAGRIAVEGLVPLADGLNFAMERLRVYLQT
jgi:hypothetical protein